MYELTIPAMSCGHCQKTITQALRELDSTATLNFDMAARKLALETKAGLSVVKQALDDAGYPVESRSTTRRIFMQIIRAMLPSTP
jgi:copper chaperone